MNMLFDAWWDRLNVAFIDGSDSNEENAAACATPLFKLIDHKSRVTLA